MTRLDQAAAAYSRGLRVVLGLDGQSPLEAAQLAYTPGGPSIDELAERIQARRGERLAA